MEGALPGSGQGAKDDRPGGHRPSGLGGETHGELSSETVARPAPRRGRAGRDYLGASASAPGFLRWAQLYFFWNFSTRPVVSKNFILPVKNGWQAEQISTAMFFRVLRVVNLLPQPHTTVASTYSG